MPNSDQNSTFDSNDFVSGNNTNPYYGDVRNDPALSYLQDHGPIPPGSYTIESQRANSNRRDLTQDDNNEMHGRFGFQTHGCSNQDTCSDGCIAATKNSVRDGFNNLMSLEEGDNTLIVVPSLRRDPNLRGL